MLSDLRISNFALLEDVELHFDPKLNVVTGETGAGKSMLLQAIALLRGGRANTEWIRVGREEAIIEALFVFQPHSPLAGHVADTLEQAGISATGLANEGLVVRRVLSTTGRHRISIAGQFVSLATLSAVCGTLMDVSNQQESQTLLDTKQHLYLVDRMGTDPALLSHMAQSVQALKAVEQGLQQREQEETQRVQREEWARFQWQELEQAQLQQDEEVTLTQHRERLRASVRLQTIARRCEDILEGSTPSVISALTRVQQEFAQVSAIEPSFASWIPPLRDALFSIEEVTRQLQRYIEKQEIDPQRLSEVEDRLYLIGKLLRKHGVSFAALLEKRHTFEAELQQGLQSTERFNALRHQKEQFQSQAVACAERLSQQREQVAVHIAQQVNEQLPALSLPHARISVRLAPTWTAGEEKGMLVQDQTGRWRKLTPQGWDHCEFWFSPHPGDPPKPLARIASGGELSRVLLALKQVLGDADGVAIQIFDEVDTGLDGVVAEQVGRQLLRLSERKQVLCVTHLAQVAAVGHAHFHVAKEIGTQTTSLVRRLSPPERELEIARIAGGNTLTEKTKAYARELLERSVQEE